MAEFNKDIVSESCLDDQEHKMKCAMMIMECLSNEDYKALKEDWNKVGGVKVIKWWEFIFNNISVKYEK